MISVLQENTNFSAGGVTSFSLAFNGAVQPGSSIHVMAAVLSRSTVLSCSDSVNGSYGTALDTIVSSVAGGQTNAHWKFDNTITGEPTITITSTTATTIGVWIREIGSTSGFDKHSAQDQVTPGSGANAVSSGIATPSQAPGLISAIAGEIVGAAGYTAGTGFTQGLYSDNTMTESIRYTTTAAAAGTFTDANGATGESITVAAWFREKIAGAGPMPRQIYVMD